MARRWIGAEAKAEPDSATQNPATRVAAWAIILLARKREDSAAQAKAGEET